MILKKLKIYEIKLSEDKIHVHNNADYRKNIWLSILYMYDEFTKTLLNLESVEMQLSCYIKWESYICGSIVTSSS